MLVSSGLSRLRARQEWKFFAALPKADRPLATAWYTAVVMRGVLPAVFAVAMGVLIGAVQHRHHLAGPLTLVGVVFVLLQVLAPIHQALSTNLGQMQSQMQALSEKFNALTAVSQAAAPARSMSTSSSSSKPPAMTKRVRARAATHQLASRRKPADDPRFNQMQQQLSEQQKQLASTREDVEKTRNELDGKLNSTRADLDGRLSSTRDELNGSIARTHEQLVALEKRGERKYYEFQLDKSKSFQRVGPISLSLRKVNAGSC